jgi:hypothetical protein
MAADLKLLAAFGNNVNHGTSLVRGLTVGSRAVASTQPVLADLAIGARFFDSTRSAGTMRFQPLRAGNGVSLFAGVIADGRVHFVHATHSSKSAKPAGIDRRENRFGFIVPRAPQK